MPVRIPKSVSSQKNQSFKRRKLIDDGLFANMRGSATMQEKELILDLLASLEDTEPVPILEFIESKHYLDMADAVYPAGKWMLKCFYEPWDCYEDVLISWLGDTYAFDGLKTKGYTKEDLETLQFNRLVAVIGQRFGKSFLSAICVLYELYKLLCRRDPTTVVEGIAPGTEISISVGATSQTQAQGTVWAYVEEFRDSSPWFSRYISACRQLKLGGESVYRANSLEFAFKHKNLLVNAVHANSKGLRGATRACVVMDEIGWFGDGAKMNGDEVAEAMINSTATFKHYGRAIAISSPQFAADKVCRMYAECTTQFESEWFQEEGWEPLTEYEGQPVIPKPGTLGFHYPTWEVNPHLSYEETQNLSPSIEAWKRNFGAYPSQAKEPFFTNPTKIDAIFDGRPCPISDIGVIDPSLLKPTPGINNYYLHVDVGAGKPSNFGICLGHVERRPIPNSKDIQAVIVIDLAYAVKADKYGEMDYDKARGILDYIISKFPGIHYSSDSWNDVEYSQRIKNLVLKVEVLVLSITEYSELKTQIYTDCVSCHEMTLVGNELKRLELVNGKRIEKGHGFTKDVADCLASVVYRATRKTLTKRPSVRASQGVYAGVTPR